MPQISVKKPIGDRFKSFVLANRGSDSFQDYSGTLIQEGLQVIEGNGDYISIDASIEAYYSRFKLSQIEYTKLGQMAGLMDSIKIHKNLSTRRSRKEAIYRILEDRGVVVFEFSNQGEVTNVTIVE